MATQMYIGDTSGLLPWVVRSNVSPTLWWFQEDVLGQYFEASVSGTQLTTTRQILWCPSVAKPTTGLFSGYGLNLRVLPSSHDLSMEVDFPLSRIVRPKSLVVIGVDGGDRFHPGYNTPPQCYGSVPGTTSNWSAGDPNCYYNWLKRHRNGTNAMFLDGHVSWVADLRQDVQQGTLFVAR